VFFANFDDVTAAPRIALSNCDGIRQLVEHLLEHGHERIAYIGGTPTVTSGSERLSAFRAAMEKASLGERALVGLTDAEWTLASAEAAASALLDLPDPPTAFVAGSDNFALAVLKALHAAGRRIPEDVALVAFQDPDRVGGVIRPPLTTLVPQERELGAQAAGMLIRLLAGAEVFGPRAEVRLPARLVVRRSCGCAETGA
jgi:LacI family transcriptional regulator